MSSSSASSAATPPRGPASAPAGQAPSLPLSPRAASLLAYSAGWLSGALVLALEGRRLGVRHHAAQSLVGFGTISLTALALVLAAGLSLFTSITAFRVLLWSAQGVVLVGVGFWLLALVQAARGADWRWPLVAPYADRLARLGEPIGTSRGERTKE